MASPTRWTWVWVSSGTWWWTGKPGVLKFMGLQKVRHDWAIELNWTEGAELLKICLVLIFIYGVRWGFNELSSTVQHNLLTMPSTLYITLSLEYRREMKWSCSVMSDSLQPYGLQHTRLPCPSPSPRAYSNSCPLSQRHNPTISSSVVPFSSHLQSSPGQGLFQWVSSSHQVAKVLEFQLQHQSLQWIFRTDFL